MKSISLPLWATGLMLATSLLSSCEDKLEGTTPGRKSDIVSSDSTGVYKDGMFNGTPIRYKEINGRAVWQGDIVLTPEQLGQETDPKARITGSGPSDVVYRWPDAVIPYEIAPNVFEYETNTIKTAIARWQDKTSIQFVPRTNQTDYVRFVLADENSSNIGKQGGMQEIRLEEGVSSRVALHEIGHAVGLLHEHTRSDRDKWITVKWENVDEEGNELLQTYATRFPWLSTFGKGSLDYNSVMIYGHKAFSKNGKPTMVRNDNGPAWSLDDRLSAGDVNTVEQMYANLYIVWSDNLFSVSTKTGKYVNMGLGWKGAAKGIAEQDRYIWAIHGGTLWRTDRFTGNYQAMGNEDWSGPVVGLTGAEPGGFFYAQQGTRLWKVGGNGKRARLGGPQALENWSGTQAIYNHNGALYVVHKNTLYKINLSTGLVDKTYPGNWFDVKGMAAPYGKSPFLYIMLAEHLWRVNTGTGAIEFVRDGFPKVTAMSGVGGNLFMVSGDNLFRVNEKGAREQLSTGWTGASSMGAIHNANGLF